MSRRPQKIFGVVLAGGKSRRFGRSKVLVPIAGSPMAGWGVRALRDAGLAVGVVSDSSTVAPALGVPGRADLEKGRGPIGGLWTALGWAKERGYDGVLLLACDMPLVTGALLRLVLGWDQTAPAVLPMGASGPEPLCALYRETCLPEVERRLRSDDLSMRGLATAVGAVLVSEKAVAAVADPGRAFTNVNSEADRDHVEALLQPSLPT